MVWAYPLEFTDASTAGQVSASPFQFTRITGSHLFCSQGYAIMDSTMPVVGDPETMNDTFIEQIVASSASAIDKAVDLGVPPHESAWAAIAMADLAPPFAGPLHLFRAVWPGAVLQSNPDTSDFSQSPTFWEAKEIS